MTDQRHWSLRKELYNIFHQWYWMIAAFAVGCLIGWLGSILFTGNYMAESVIHVGLNPYRAYRDSNFVALARPKYSNIDDYKNWQMNELESAIFLDSVIDETLTQLKQTDPYWSSISEAELVRLLRTDWRTAGEWSLYAENQESAFAQQAVQAWTDAALDRVELGIQSAQKTIATDNDIRFTSDRLNEIDTRTLSLASTRSILAELLLELSSISSEQSPSSATHYQTVAIVTAIADYSAGWQRVLDTQPEPGSDKAAYEQWISNVIQLTEIEISQLVEESEFLDQKLDKLEQTYSNQVEASLGFSPTIEIEKIDGIVLTRNSAPKTLILIGGVLGLLGWLMIQLIRITRMNQSE